MIKTFLHVATKTRSTHSCMPPQQDYRVWTIKATNKQHKIYLHATSLKISFSNKHTSKLARMFIARFWAGALGFPSNRIVSLLASDLWHFQHSSHLLVSHLPGSTPAARY